MKLLDVKNLSVNFKTGKKSAPVVTKISFSVKCGEILAIVGESGCGKSVTNLAITKLLDEKLADIQADYINILHDKKYCNLINADAKTLRKIRGGVIAYIFQEPSVSLNPVFKIGSQIAEALHLHRTDVKDEKAEIIRLLELVGIPDAAARLNAYPHELSGGMQQRIMIAMALACQPDLLIADEPTTALDVTIQAQILELIANLCKKRNMGVILITHNLGIVNQIADNVAVMYGGIIVEKADCNELIKNPLHPYTKKLLAAVPKLGGNVKRLATIPGSVPSPADYPEGCRFCDRCAVFKQLDAKHQHVCRENLPPEREILPGHFISCFFPEIEKELL